jgi:hypothetical protein
MGEIGDAPMFHRAHGREEVADLSRGVLAKMSEQIKPKSRLPAENTLERREVEGPRDRRIVDLGSREGRRSR